MDDTKLDRRELFKKGVIYAGGLIGGVALLNPSVSLGESAPAAKKTFKLIDEVKNPTARQFKYTHDATKSPHRKMDYAICGNCQLYRKKGELDGVEVGSCNMIGGGMVKVTGWCSSYVRDAKAFKK